MRVDKITLANFKCFEERTFNLKPGFSLVVGTNGKGKTTLLDGLAVGLGSLFLGFPSPAKQRHIHKDDVLVRFFRHPDETTVPKHTCDGCRHRGQNCDIKSRTWRRCHFPNTWRRVDRRDRPSSSPVLATADH